MHSITHCSRPFLVACLLGITLPAQAQTSYSTIRDVNNNYGSSVPPNQSISYIFTSTLDLSGCQYNWAATNSSNYPDGFTVSLGTAASPPYVWKNVNANASITVTTHDCDKAASNGATATYSVPIRYLGQVGSISSSVGSYLSCGAQTVTFSAGAATNATSYTWDYSNLSGWSYVSGQGTTTLTLTSSPNTGGSISVTARRSDANSVSTSSNYSISRPSQPTPTISGPANICPGGTATYTVGNYLDGSSFSWSNSTNIQLVGGQASTQATVQAQSEGSGNIHVDVTNACGTIPANYGVNIGNSIGGYYTNGYDAPRPVQDNNSVTLQQNSPTGTIVLNSSWGSQATYSWTVTNQSPSGAYFYYNTSDHSSVNIHCDGGKNITVVCTVSTPCGTRQISFSGYNTSSYRAVTLTEAGQPTLTPLHIWPNPTKGATLVGFRLAEQEPAVLSVVNLLGVPIHKQEVVGTGADQTVSFDLSREGTGMYLIQLQNGQGKQVGKVRLER